MPCLPTSTTSWLTVRIDRIDKQPPLVDVFNPLSASLFNCLPTFTCLSVSLPLLVYICYCSLGASAVLIKPIDLAIFNATMKEINEAK